MVTRNTKRKNLERGDTVMEFAAALPLFLLLMAGIGIFAWVFWAQAAADVAAIRGLKDASTGSGSSSFESSMNALTNGKTAGAVGGADVSVSDSQRMVNLDVAGSIRLLFGPLDSVFNFGGGGAGRLWRFWPGPPSPWE